MRKPLLFLLHFAGGSKYSYNFLNPFLDKFEVKAIELPGRGERMGEDLITSFESALEDTVEQIRKHLTGSDYVIYGHSMGAMLALGAVNELGKNNEGPKAIVVTGNAGPGTYEPTMRSHLGHEEFVEELINLGGFPIEVIENEELFEMFEPILRADFKIAETNYKFQEIQIEIPIYTVMGNEEKNNEKIRNWEVFANSTLESEILPGDHFFIHEHAQKIAEKIDYSYDHNQVLQN